MRTWGNPTGQDRGQAGTGVTRQTGAVGAWDAPLLMALTVRDMRCTVMRSFQRTGHAVTMP